MADSRLWRDLAEQFEGLDDPFGFLRANWHEDPQTGNSSWTIETPRNEKPVLLAKCRSLVRRGGTALDPHRDSEITWLDELRRREMNVEMTGTMLHVDSYGGSSYGSTGTIIRLAEASAILCRTLEAASIETERIANLPKNSRDRLSAEARKRIDRAHIEADKFRWEAESIIESQQLQAEAAKIGTQQG
jgi:hypothetical protein